jgi:4-hydroxymandelate oxidase
VALETVAATGVDLCLQLYWLRDRGRLLDMVERAAAGGCRCLMVTVDVPVFGRRLRDLRNAFALPSQITAANLDTGARSAAHTRRSGQSALAHHARLAFEPALRWADIEWLLGRTSLPLAVKGILDPGDGRLAAGIGIDTVVVSNHGGRQFDAAPPGIAALPSVVEAVDDRCAVLFDSGVRTGTDIIRALALGARGVLVGRPVLWGLAVDGARGVEHVLSLLGAELADALMLTGCADIAGARTLRTALAPDAGT